MQQEGEEGGDQQREGEGQSYNRVLANLTDTSIVLQSVGYRCFAAMDPYQYAGDDQDKGGQDEDDNGNDWAVTYNKRACATRTVVRVDPCNEAATTDIVVNDTTGAFYPEMGMFNLRNFLDECVGYSNYTAVFDETISDILQNLEQNIDNTTGIKGISVTLFENNDRANGDDSETLLECLTSNTTALSVALCENSFCVQSSNVQTPSPTQEPEEESSEPAEESSSSNMLVYGGIAAAVLVVLCVAGYFFYPSSKGPDGHQPLKGDGESYGAA